MVVAGQVVAGSEYLAEGRRALHTKPTTTVWHFAETVAKALPAPEQVYVLDVGEADGDLHLMELNPFSGADLYACDGKAVVDAVSQMLQGFGLS